MLPRFAVDYQRSGYSGFSVCNHSGVDALFFQIQEAGEVCAVLAMSLCDGYVTENPWGGHDVTQAMVQTVNYHGKEHSGFM